MLTEDLFASCCVAGAHKFGILYTTMLCMAGVLKCQPLFCAFVVGLQGFARGWLDGAANDILWSA